MLNVRLPVSVFVVLLLTLLLASRFPIYPDEVAYRILLERFYLSGGFKTSLLPYCLDGFEVAPPLILKGTAIFWSVLSHINPNVLYRWLPSFFLITSFASFYLFIHRYGRINSPWYLMLFVSGVSIYGLSIFRPEVLIALAMLWIAIIGLYVIRERSLSHKAIIILGGFLLSIFYITGYVHPKALYLILPVVLVFTLMINVCLDSAISVFVLLLMISFTFLDTFYLIKIHNLGYVSCSNFNDVEVVMKTQGVNVISLFTHPNDFLNNFFLANNHIKYLEFFHKVGFHSSSEVGFIPNIHKNFLTLVADIFVYFTILSTLTVLLAFVILKFKMSWRERREYWLFLSLLVVVFFQFFLNAVRHWYDISLTIFSLGFLTFLALNLKLGETRTSVFRLFIRVSDKLQSFLIIAILLSLAVNFLYIYKKFDNRYVGPGLSTKINFNELNKAAQFKFRFDYHDTALPIIVDDLTYHAFFRHRKVYPVTYLLIYARKNPKTIDIVVNNRSLTAITQCGYMEAFRVERKVKFLDKMVYVDGEGINYEICKWEAS